MNLSAIKVILAGLVFSHAALSAPFVVESFSYSDGPLSGLNGGSGWSGPWFGVGASVMQPGLNYTDGERTLDVGGGAVGLFGSGGMEFRNLSLNVTSGSSLYFSFIAQVTAGANVNLNFNVGSTQLLIGRLPDSSTWGIQDLTGDRAVSAVSTSVESLLVLHIDILTGGGSNFRLYVNPSLGTEPSVADAFFTRNDSSLMIGQLRLQGIPNGTVNAVFDELRFGATYGDVTPFSVPEPSAFSFLVLAFTLAGIAAFRRAGRAPHQSQRVEHGVSSR